MTPAPVFVHIPRTGGRSVRVALDLGFGEIHLSALEQERRVGVGAWKDTFSFAFVRNPWDRAISIWAFLHRHRGPEALTPEAFRDWVGFGMLHPSGCEPTLYAGTPHAIRVTAPQLEFIGDGRTICVSWVGRHERIEEDFQDLARTLRVTASLHHLNRVPRSLAPAEYYDQVSLEQVGERYRSDAEVFGYTGPSTTISGPSGQMLTGIARGSDSASQRNPGPGFRFR